MEQLNCIFRTLNKLDFLKKYLFLFIFIFSSLIQGIEGQCSSSSKIEDSSTCFNGIIRFGGGYRAGQFSIMNDGLLYIEYSSDRNRLFFGLKSNGRGIFPNDATNKELSVETNSYDYENNLATERYESRNIIVYMSNDNLHLTPYIFSVSSYKGLTELHYFDNNGNNSHKTWLTPSFFGINDKKRYIFSFQFNLLEGDSNLYYATYVQYKGTNEKKDDYSVSYTLSKFKFNSLDTYEKQTNEFGDNYDNRIVSSFIMDNYHVLVVFFLRSGPATYKFRMHDLSNFNILKEIEIKKIADDSGNDKAFPGEGIFFKGHYLRYEYVAIIYFTEKDNGKSLTLKILYFTNSNYDYTVRLKKYINTYDFSTSITLNEFYKINYEKLLFVSTIHQTKLVLMFFDFCNWYHCLKIRTYQFDLTGYYFNKELAVDYFNGYLMLTSTVSPNGGHDLSSILLFFGYPNGTDFYMNISPYVTNSEYYVTGNNLISYLLNTKKIENNIFDYSSVNEIKLISIPEEIIFSRTGSGAVVNNGENIDSNNILTQNKDLIKFDRNYTLDYQFMAKGKSSYSDVYNQAQIKESISDSECQISEFNTNEYYSQQIYYGRVNRLTFRLCHDYCETCKELGNLVNNNDQKCLSCLPQYTYDYYNYFNIFPENCVPEGYFNVLGTEKKIVQCTAFNSKFYYNKTDHNKRICFDKEKECPDTYAFLNVTTNECLNYTPPIPTTIPVMSTTIPIIPTTIPKIPTTIPKILTTIPKIPTTIQVIPTTLPKILTTIPKLPTTIPKIPTTIPKIPTTLPKAPTTIPKIKTTIPIILTTIPKIPTTYITPIPTTIVNKIPTTISEPKHLITNNPTSVINIPTTIKEEVPTTVIITVPKIKTTSPEIIPTTLFKTTILKTQTTIPTVPNIPTTIPEALQTTIPKIIPSIIYQDKCLNGTFITNLCANISNEELLSRLKSEIFESYSSDKEAKIYSGKSNYAFRVSNTLNEMKDFNSSNGLSLLDLGECEALLKAENNIPAESELIILKKEKIDNDPSEKDVIFEIYDPITYKKLNLSICDNIPFDLYVPMELSEDLEQKYYNLVEQGFNPFDLGDKFYREICTPYKSENGTDVLLDDREEFFYYPLAEQMVCQNNCQYSSYSADTKYMKCECGNNKTAVTLNIKHLSKENIAQSFLSTFRSTNYKVMRCYNLVFNLKIFFRNYGSMIIFLFFVVYILFMIHYCRKDIYPLRIEISKIIFNPSQNEIMEEYNKFAINQYEKPKIKDKGKQSMKMNKNKKVQNPPKKQAGKKITNSTRPGSNSPDSKILVFSKGIYSNSKKKTTSIHKKEYDIIKKDIMTEKNILTPYENKSSVNNLKNRVETEIKVENNLDNFELNNLDYDEACELDKRGFCKTYWSVLMREHLFIFTFLACNDYNLFYIKIERFLTLACIEMSVNGLFFVHESMHRKYVEGEDFTFVQKLPQLLFTWFASNIIEVILCYMGITDTFIYEIKALPKSDNRGEKIINIIDKMKNRLICFFIFTFLLFLFNWYFISAFCAVYQNTQIIFLRDSGISFLVSIIDPFLIYGGTTLLRYISLTRCCKKKLGCVYKLSDLIPIF